MGVTSREVGGGGEENGRNEEQLEALPGICKVIALKKSTEQIWWNVQCPFNPFMACVHYYLSWFYI